MNVDITIGIIYAFALGWAMGYFTEVVANHFQEKEDETI